MRRTFRKADTRGRADGSPEHEARPDVTIGAGCSHTLRVEIPRRSPEPAAWVRVLAT